MGLDVYIDYDDENDEEERIEVWHGAYSAFMRFRVYIARMAGICLDAMWGYNEYKNFGNSGPIMCPFRLYHTEPHGWSMKYDHLVLDDSYEPIQFPPKEEEPLVVLLDHSDCGGTIEWEDCKRLGDRLTQLYNRMKDDDLGGHIGNVKEKTKVFIDGCYKAFELKKNLIFS